MKLFIQAGRAREPNEPRGAIGEGGRNLGQKERDDDPPGPKEFVAAPSAPDRTVG